MNEVNGDSFINNALKKLYTGFLDYKEIISGIFDTGIDFSGRASRLVYIAWLGFLFIVRHSLDMINYIIYSLTEQSTILMIPVSIVSFLINLALLLMSLSLSTRRLHDFGYSGLWLLLWLGLIMVTFVFYSLTHDGSSLNWLLVACLVAISLGGEIILCVTPGEKLDNEHGLVPY